MRLAIVLLSALAGPIMAAQDIVRPDDEAGLLNKEFRYRASVILEVLRNLESFPEAFLENDSPDRDQVLVFPDAEIRAKYRGRCDFWAETSRTKPRPAQETREEFLCRFEEAIAAVKVVFDYNGELLRTYRSDDGKRYWRASHMVFTAEEGVITVDPQSLRTESNLIINELILHELLRYLGKNDDPVSEDGLYRKSSTLRAHLDFAKPLVRVCLLKPEVDFLIDYIRRRGCTERPFDYSRFNEGFRKQRRINDDAVLGTDLGTYHRLHGRIVTLTSAEEWNEACAIQARYFSGERPNAQQQSHVQELFRAVTCKQ